MRVGLLLAHIIKRAPLLCICGAVVCFSNLNILRCCLLFCALLAWVRSLDISPYRARCFPYSTACHLSPILLSAVFVRSCLRFRLQPFATLCAFHPARRCYAVAQNVLEPAFGYKINTIIFTCQYPKITNPHKYATIFIYAKNMA
jgi:hypothetical protein